MNLYEINLAIEKAFDEAIDPETGEILSENALAYLDELEMARDTKIENIGCWIKNLDAEAEALKKEKQAFADRQKRAEKKSASLRRYLSSVLDGQKFQTEKVAISFRKSESVQIDDESQIPAPYIKQKIETMPDKTAIKKAIKAGVVLPGASLVESQNVQIK